VPRPAVGSGITMVDNVLAIAAAVVAIAALVRVLLIAGS
jgi:hypothetical protein